MVTLVDQSAHGEKPRSSVSRSCRACGESLKDDDENLVRALGETFHTRCFVCEHCHTAPNGKFYMVEHRIVCERHYYAYLGLICQQCQQPILDADGTTNYHRSCLVTSCAHSGCNNERCFEWNDRMYCRHHFSLLPETHCASCDEAILKQFVEHHSYPGKRWHPECYMIQKFWNVRLTQGTTTTNSNQDDSVVDEQQLRRRQATMEAKVNRIWTELSAYEESSATCISDMLLHVAAGAYSEALRMANQFVTHLQVLFSALELMNAMLLAESGQGLLCFQESRSLCSLVVCFFHLLAQDPKTTKPDPCGGRGVRDTTLQQQHQHQLNATTTTSAQGLLSMVTGIAQNLKALIRIGLTGALKLERQFDRQDAVSRFLDSLLPLEKKRVWIAGRYWFKDEPPSFPISRNDAIVEQQQYCQRCYQLILQDDECYRQGTLQWHTLCFSCVRCNRQLGNDLQKARLGGHPTAEQQRQSDAVTLVLLCSSCCSAAANDYSVGGNFVHVTQLEKSLGLVTTALSRLYATLYYVPHPPPPPPPPATPAAPAVREQEDKLAMQYHQDTKRVLLQDYDVRVNTETATKATSRKRHPSLLRLMGGASRGNSNNRQSLFGSAHLIHVPVKRATSVFEPTTKTATPTSNRFGTLQRAFSNSNRRRERRSLYGVFDRSSTPNSVSGKQQIQQDEYLPDTASTILSPLLVQITATITTTTTATTTSPVPRRLSLAELSTIQDTIVRHMAILYVERYASHLYSTEQLLQFVVGKRSSLWGRLKAHIRHGRLSSSSYSSTEEGMRIFGVPLSEAVTRGGGRDITAADQGTSTTTVCFLRDSSTSHATSSMAVYFSANAQVPEFVRKCISRLLTMDMTVEGVFRKNGNIRELNELRDAISHDCSFNATSYMDNEESPIQLAALLKRYLRELPEPLLTFRLYNLFIASTRIEQEDATRAKTILHMACCMLPKPHRDTMQLLFLFLKWVASFQAANKMDVHNLACVFAPTIFYSPHASKDTPEERQQGARDEIKVVEMLIHYQDEFCMVPQEFIDVIHNSQAADCFKDGVGSRQALRKLQALVEVRPMEEKSETLSPADDAVAASIVRSNAAAAAGTTNAKRMQRRSWIPGRLVQQ